MPKFSAAILTRCGIDVSATPTFTVKLACVSFYKNLEKNLPPGSGIFIVVNAITGGI